MDIKTIFETIRKDIYSFWCSIIVLQMYYKNTKIINLFVRLLVEIKWTTNKLTHSFESYKRCIVILIPFNIFSVSEINSLFRAKSRKEILKNEVLYCSCLRETEKDTLLGNKKVKGKKETKADCTWQENLPLCKPLNVKESKCQNYGRNKREIDDDLEFDVAEEVVNFKESNEVRNCQWRRNKVK